VSRRSPENIDIGFDLFPASGRTGAQTGSGVDLQGFHGGTDASTERF